MSGWVRGEVDGFRFEAKVYDNPSTFGLDPENPRQSGYSRVSKLGITKASGRFEDMVYNYDRGFDFATEEGVELAKKVAEMYPHE